MSGTRPHRIWSSMKARCKNPNSPAFVYYGGRGITYESKWDRFEGFWEDMGGTYSDNLSLDRIDVNGNYCEENCRWATSFVQAHNRRKQQGTVFKSIGVMLLKNKYVPSIRICGNRLRLGYYDTEEEAALVYDIASEILFKDRPNKTIENPPNLVEKVNFYIENKDSIINKKVHKGEGHVASKLTSEEVLEIIDLLDCRLFTSSDIGMFYGVSRRTIGFINTGDTWNSVTQRKK